METHSEKEYMVLIVLRMEMQVKLTKAYAASMKEDPYEFQKNGR